MAKGNAVGRVVFDRILLLCGLVKQLRIATVGIVIAVSIVDSSKGNTCSCGGNVMAASSHRSHGCNPRCRPSRPRHNARSTLL